MRDAIDHIQQKIQAIVANTSKAHQAVKPGDVPMWLSTGWPAIDACESSPGLPWRGVHELFGAFDHAHVRMPAMSLALHLAWRVVLQAPSHARVVWVGRHAWPHPRSVLGGLRGLCGGRRRRVDLRLWRASVFLDATGLSDRLWSVQMALQAPDAWMVVADGARCDLTATRRLQLAATACPVLLLRPLEELSQPSAASLRWRVQPAADASHAWWSAELLRVRAGRSLLQNASVHFGDWWERGEGLDAVRFEEAMAWLPRKPRLISSQCREESHGTHAGDPVAMVARGPSDSIAPTAGGLAA